jgi:hypothetical protein
VTWKRWFTVPSIACCLPAGQTVNGIDIGAHPAQGGDTFCERNLLLCSEGVAAVAAALP